MNARVFVDVLWSAFILTAIEQSRIAPGITKTMLLDLQYIRVSHSLVTVRAWGALFGGVYFAFKGDARAALVLFIRAAGLCDARGAHLFDASIGPAVEIDHVELIDRAVKIEGRTLANEWSARKNRSTAGTDFALRNDYWGHPPGESAHP